MSSTTAPAAGRAADEGVHLGLRADVDAPGRVVEQQDRRLRVEPLREDDLLLVAAGQLARARVDRRRAHLQALDLVARVRAQAPRADQRPVGGQRDRADLADVVPHGLVEHEAEAPPVARDERDARADRAAQPAGDRPAAGQQDRAALRPPPAAHAARGPSCARRPRSRRGRRSRPVRAMRLTVVEPPGRRDTPSRRSGAVAAPAAVDHLGHALGELPGRLVRRPPGPCRARSPSIASTIAVVVSSARGTPASDGAPSRSTVTSSQSAEDLLEDVRDEHDRDLALAQDAAATRISASVLAASRAEVGSSRISTRGSVTSALATSTSWRCASDSDADRRRSGTSRPSSAQDGPRARGHLARGR